MWWLQLNSVLALSENVHTELLINDAWQFSIVIHGINQEVIISSQIFFSWIYSWIFSVLSRIPFLQYPPLFQSDQFCPDAQKF